ncbi:MAG: hypothetical protein RLY32_89 [Pseudomonadota bacterium]
MLASGIRDGWAVAIGQSWRRVTCGNRRWVRKLMWRLLEQGIGPPSHVGTRYFESKRHSAFYSWS